MSNFIVPEQMSKLSLKDYLRRHEHISLNLWRRIKREAAVYINKELVDPVSATVHADDIIDCRLPQITTIKPVELPLDIVYEDEYLMVINKPANQLVHPTGGEHEHTLGNAIMHYYQQNNLALNYHPVHRLDKNTSGLILIAKQAHIQNLFTFEAKKKTLTRIYSAIVHGHISPTEGSITSPIGRKPGSIIERMVTQKGQPALTYYKTIQTFNNHSLVELQLATGRTHQIRVHMSSIGHPLLGDDLYGGNRAEFHRQALHASQLSFIHPVTAQSLSFDSQLPDDILRVFDRL